MKIWSYLFVAFLAACTTNEKKPEETWNPPAPPRQVVVPPKTEPTYRREDVRVDFATLIQKLRMRTEATSLGYREKSFNSCEVGSGFSTTEDCHSENLIIVHLQLMCRDSDGTVSEVVTDANLAPIGNQSLKWNLGSLAGLTRSDRDGFAEIQAVSTKSLREGRLRITLDNDFLFLRAGGVARVIAPKQWCR